MTGPETKRSVTRLSFENHTACECVGRNSDLMPRTEPYSGDPSVVRLSPPSLLYNDEGKATSRHHVDKKNQTKKGLQVGRHDDPPPPQLTGRVATAYSPDPALLLRRRNEDDSAGAKRRSTAAAWLGSNHSK